MTIVEFLLAVALIIATALFARESMLAKEAEKRGKVEGYNEGHLDRARNVIKVFPEDMDDVAKGIKSQFRHDDFIILMDIEGDYRRIPVEQKENNTYVTPDGYYFIKFTKPVIDVTIPVEWDSAEGEYKPISQVS